MGIQKFSLQQSGLAFDQDEVNIKKYMLLPVSDCHMRLFLALPL